MVKLGFIVEGATEKIILSLSDFFPYLDSLGLLYISDVRDANGNGNLLPKNLEAHTKVLEDEGATHIFILTDIDNDECITNTKARIEPKDNHIIIVSVKTIEAWFLSDDNAMQAYLNDPAFHYDNPEMSNHPYDEIKSLRMARLNRGPVSKTTLANTMVKNHNFSIQRAAAHPNCNSVRYFLQKINEMTRI